MWICPFSRHSSGSCGGGDDDGAQMTMAVMKNGDHDDVVDDKGDDVG